MTQKSKKSQVKPEMVNIPIESIKKIDELIRSGTTMYFSRDDFIRNAVEIKLMEMRIPKPEGSRK